MYTIHNLLNRENNPVALDVLLQRIRMLLARPVTQQMIQHPKTKKLSLSNTLNYGYFIRHNYKQEAQELLEIYSKLDAFYSIATACMRYNFSFPAFTPGSLPHFNA